MRSYFFYAAIACAGLSIIAGCTKESQGIVQPSATPAKSLYLKWRQLTPQAPAVMRAGTSDPEGHLYALSPQGVERSMDNGENWNTVSAVADAQCIAAGPGGLVLIGTSNGMVVSRDGGKTWAKTGPTSGAVYSVLIASTGAQFAVPDGQLLSRRYWISQDGGANWELVGTVGFLDAVYIAMLQSGVILKATYEARLFAGSYYRLEQTTDRGKTWLSVARIGSVKTMKSGQDGTIYITGSTGGILRLDPSGLQTGICDSSCSNLNISSDGTLLATIQNEIVRSTDRGTSWKRIPDVNPPMVVIGPDNGKCFFATTGSSLWRLSPQDPSWALIKLGQITSDISCLMFDPGSGNLLAGTVRSGAFRSSDKGSTWQWIKFPWIPAGQ